MSSLVMNSPSSAQPPRNGRVSFGTHTSSHSLLLERAKANVNRRPTPDSEVMVSSDDEHPNGAPLPLRRGSTSRPASSWLGDVGHNQPTRKYSTGGLSMASAGSQPPTPSTESTPRMTTQGQGRPNTSVSFGHNIWASDRGKDFNRFDQVPHSPLSLTPLNSESTALSSRDRRYSGIGVDIPLNPTFKPQQQRAMSFSVAPQQTKDDDDIVSPLQLQRFRTGLQGSNVTRKASLSRVREDEDDGGGLRHGVDYEGIDSQNLLKRAVRHRTFSTNVPGYLDSPWGNSQRRSSTLPVVEGAIEEAEPYPLPESRRHSLAHVVTGPHGHSAIHSRTFNDQDSQNLDYTHHQPLSTPHSSSTNQPAITPLSSSTSHSEEPSSTYTGYFSHRNHQDLQRKASLVDPSAYPEYLDTMPRPGPGRTVQEMDVYKVHPKIAGPDMNLPVIFPIARQPDHDGIKPVEACDPNQIHGTEANNPRWTHQDMRYLMYHADRYFRGDRHLYDDTSNQPLHPSVQQPDYARHTGRRPGSSDSKGSRKILHLIKFKCERAEVYYVPENTGLQLTKGQLVIVDGDRGFDIGEVEIPNIDPSEVKHLRQAYQEKHFIWLMVFSRARETNPAVRWALSNLDPHKCSERHPDNENNDDGRAANFKLIKRIAIPIEFASLQEKEGDEAKAKRVCQQKVIDHGLDMEILDAEFQLDRHKLTYYYYAEKYINFNELVNDLFKIFKTRIWMSAVNPASFAPQGARTYNNQAVQSPPTRQIAVNAANLNIAQLTPSRELQQYAATLNTQPFAPSSDPRDARGMSHRQEVPYTTPFAEQQPAYTPAYGYTGNAQSPYYGYPAANMSAGYVAGVGSAATGAISTGAGFGSYAQPWTNPGWNPSSSFAPANNPWGPPTTRASGAVGTTAAPFNTNLAWAGVPAAALSFPTTVARSQASAAVAPTGPIGPRTARSFGPEDVAVQPPRKRSATEQARDEATKAAFQSSVEAAAAQSAGPLVDDLAAMKLGGGEQTNDATKDV